jgi:hypothetical protein
MCISRTFGCRTRKDSPGTVPDPLTNQLPNIIQTLIQQNSLKQDTPAANDSKSASELKTVVARERFELSSAGPELSPIQNRSDNLASLRIRDVKSVVSKFQEYCAIDERLQPRVCRDYRNTVLRFFDLPRAK